VTGVVHAIGDMIQVTSNPCLVVVGRTTSLLEELSIIGEHRQTDFPMGFIDQADEQINAKIVESD
jgi:hypothetical protein